MFTLNRLVLWQRVWLHKRHALYSLFPLRRAQFPCSSPWPGGMERYEGQEFERRKGLLLRRGLTCRVRAKKMGNLFALVLTPTTGFIRLSRPTFEKRCLKDFGKYHISIGFTVPKAGPAERRR